MGLKPEEICKLASHVEAFRLQIKLLGSSTQRLFAGYAIMESGIRLRYLSTHGTSGDLTPI